MTFFFFFFFFHDCRPLGAEVNTHFIVGRKSWNWKLSSAHSGRILKPPRQLFDRELRRMLSTALGTAAQVKISLTFRRGTVLLDSKHTHTRAHLARSCSADLNNIFILGCCCETPFSLYFPQGAYILICCRATIPEPLYQLWSLYWKKTKAALFPINNTENLPVHHQKLWDLQARVVAVINKWDLVGCVFLCFLSFFYLTDVGC